MIVGIDEGRNHERARSGCGRRALGDGGDDPVVVAQHNVFEQAAVRAGEEAGGVTSVVMAFPVIASAAKRSIAPRKKEWIASAFAR